MNKINEVIIQTFPRVNKQAEKGKNKVPERVAGSATLFRRENKESLFIPFA